jgi:hypothetical protein
MTLPLGLLERIEDVGHGGYRARKMAITQPVVEMRGTVPAL